MPFALVGISAMVLLTFSLSALPAPEVRTHVVRLRNNRFVPAEIRARSGDTLRFVNGEGGIHNVEFEKDSIAPAARTLIAAAMAGQKIGPMSGPLLILTDESYTIVVPDLPAGRYPLLCTPHYGNMRGALVVER